MAIKKRNVISINFSDKGIVILKHLKYLNNAKKATGKNISAFINKILIDYMDTYGSKDTHLINIELMKKEIRELQNKRDKLEKLMVMVAEDIQKEKRMLGN